MTDTKRVQHIREELLLKYKNEEFVIDKTGVKTVEIIGASFIADEVGIIREPNWDYVEREIQWYESQSLFVSDIPGGTPKIWQDVSSRYGEINSNYGNLIWSSSNHDQYNQCLSTLKTDIDTRRAIMIYTRPSIQHEYDRDGMSDFICTNTVQYLVRDGKLHAVVSMRSNDAWAGYQNDRAWQDYILDKLLLDLNLHCQRSGILLQKGDIYWNAGSFHLYESQFYCLDYIEQTGKRYCDISKKEFNELCKASD